MGLLTVLVYWLAEKGVPPFRWWFAWKSDD